VTKKEIGEIRIAPRETLFEIDPAVAARFQEAVRKAADGEAPIEAAQPPGPRTAPPRKAAGRRGGPPRQKRVDRKRTS
jgi:ATP-dependent RNA helicase DeaD